MPGTLGNNSASDGLDYLRSIVEDVFTNIELSASEVSASSLAGGTLVTFEEVAAGTTVDLVGLEPVGFAAAILLGAYASGWVIVKVASVFPNPSIFGFRPLNFIIEGITNLGKEWEHSALALTDDIKHWFMQPIRQILGIFQRLGNVGVTAHNKVATVVSESIPTAMNHAITSAENYAIAQVHSIATQVAGAAERLLVLPDAAQAKTLVNDAAKYGGIGWDVTATSAAAIIAASRYVDETYHKTQGDIAASAAKVTAQAQASLDQLQRQLVSRLQGDENALSSLTTTVNVQIPAEIATKVNEATATENQRLTSAVSTIDAQIKALQGQIDTITSRIATDEATITSAQRNIATLQGQQVVDTQAIDAQRQLIATAQANINTNITSIADLNTKITGISSTLGPVQAAQQLNTAQLAPFEGIGAIALPTLLATLSSTLNTVKTKVDTCMVDNCDTTSPNNIKNVLKDLLGALTAAGEIGFIAEAIRDPLGTANALAPILDSIDQGANNTWDALIGIL